MTRRILLALFLLLSAATPLSVVWAQSAGIVQIPTLLTNQSGVDQANLQAPYNLSSQSLVDSAYIDSDGLNSDVRAGSTSVPFMPGTGRVQMLGCFDNAAASETADCNDAGSDDITLPAANGEVFDFVADNQFRILHVNTSTAAVADWTVTWKYFNGGSWVALSNVQDNTDGFTTSGLHAVSWDFPLAGLWETATLNAVTGYWVRAEVTAVTTVTSAPLAAQVWYETGRWWAVLESLGPNEQANLSTHLDVPDSTKTFHYFFPATTGVTASDAADLEPGINYDVTLDGYIDATAPVSGSTKKLFFKDDAVECTIPAEGIISCQLFEAP